MFSKNSDLYFIDNQMNIKEALPVWIMPPFLLCKDNTFLSEMQIPILGQVRGWERVVRKIVTLGGGAGSRRKNRFCNLATRK